MRRALPFYLLVCLPLAAQQAPIPAATELPGSPFFIKKTWFIGGAGNWDYATMDSAARRLYIAHGRSVQVVNVDTGSLAGEIPGFRDAHAIALDDTGEFGYVSNGPAGLVKVFDRHTLAVEATIPIFCSPRSIAFEPQSELAFAVCGTNAAVPAAPPPPIRRSAAGGANASRPNVRPEPTNISGTSHVVAIDTRTKSVLVDMIMPGDFRFAQPDRDGHVYISVGAAQFTLVSNGRTIHEFVPQRIASLNAPAIAAEARRQPGQPSQPTSPPGHAVLMDWTGYAIPGTLGRFLPLSSACANPQGLAVDSKDQRLFVACEDQQFEVLNASTGGIVASLTTGPGDDAIGYDREPGLIFVANGAGYGSLTIIRQDAITDSYSVIQNLPTRERARTLAADSATGEVYLVTDFQGVDLTKPGGIGTLHADPIPGSFQVLVVGH